MYRCARLAMAVLVAFLGGCSANAVCQLRTGSHTGLPCPTHVYCVEAPNESQMVAAMRNSPLSDCHHLWVDCRREAPIQNFQLRLDVAITQLSTAALTVSGCETSRLEVATTWYEQPSHAIALTFLNLSHNAIPSIESIFAWDTRWLGRCRVLLLNNNRISSLPPFVFYPLPHLTRLEMRRNLLGDFQLDSFASNDYLEYIDLRENLIRRLNTGVFARIPRLRTLLLARNVINHIDSEVFRNMRLERLDLSDNPIVNFTASAFHNVTIKFLDLSGCRIPEIPAAFLFALHFQYLNLSANAIGSVAPGAFSGSLVSLDLSLNAITALSGDMFPDSVSALYLHGNKILEIDESMQQLFQHAGTVNLAGNELNCCSLQWLKEMLATIPEMYHPMCLYPYVEKLSQLSNLVECVEPRISSFDVYFMNLGQAMLVCKADGYPTAKVVIHRSFPPPDQSPIPMLTLGNATASMSLEDGIKGDYICAASNPVSVSTLKVRLENTAGDDPSVGKPRTNHAEQPRRQSAGVSGSNGSYVIEVVVVIACVAAVVGVSVGVGGTLLAVRILAAVRGARDVTKRVGRDGGKQTETPHYDELEAGHEFSGDIFLEVSGNRLSSEPLAKKNQRRHK